MALLDLPVGLLLPVALLIMDDLYAHGHVQGGKQGGGAVVDVVIGDSHPRSPSPWAAVGTSFMERCCSSLAAACWIIWMSSCSPCLPRSRRSWIGLVKSASVSPTPPESARRSAGVRSTGMTRVSRLGGDVIWTTSTVVPGWGSGRPVSSAEGSQPGAPSSRSQRCGTAPKACRKAARPSHAAASPFLRWQWRC